MREKAANSERTAGRAEVNARGKSGSGNRRRAGEGQSGDQPGRQKLLKVFEKNSGCEAGPSPVEVGKPSSLQVAVQSQGKERGIVPPALPVPIASFHI
jgi:hypothetical protein